MLVIMRIFRTYARAYADDLDAVLAPLTTVTGEPITNRLTMPNGLELASVGRPWIRRSPCRRVHIRWAGSVKAVLAWQRRRSMGQMPSAGLGCGA